MKKTTKQPFTVYRVLEEFEDNRLRNMKERFSLIRRERGVLPPHQHIYPVSWEDRETRFILIEFYA